MEMEVKRMGFDTQNVWRVSDINSNYKYVPGFPIEAFFLSFLI